VIAVSNLDRVVQGLSVTDFEIECTRLKQTIRHNLLVKLKELPFGVQHIMHFHCVLSGSAIASLYHGEMPKDYDLWAKSATGIATVVSHLEKMEDFVTEDTGEHYIGMSGSKYISPNAITLKNSLQFITLGDYKEQRERFDFVHCKPYYDIQSGQLFISQSQWSAIKNKQLIASPNRFPAVSRIHKFKKRGWLDAL
jgi:hypothetical protein